MRNFIRETNKDGAGFLNFENKFSRIPKIKRGIFVGPQLREQIKDGNCDHILDEREASAWQSYKTVVPSSFLGKFGIFQIILLLFSTYECDHELAF